MSFSISRSFVYGAWMVASLFYAFQYILRVMPNIMIKEIMQTFGMSEAHFGQFSGIYYIGYALSHIPLGLVLDRFGPRKIMTGAILLSIAGLLPLTYSDSAILAIIGRLCTGIGSSAAILSVFCIIRTTFPAKLFSRMLSFSVTIGLLGAIYGGGPVSALQNSYGSSFVISLFTLFGVGLAGISYWMIPNTTTRAQTGILAQIFTVTKNVKFVVTCTLAGFFVGPLEGFADVWGTTFLESTYGYDKTTCASFTSLIFVGMCFGAPLLSIISEKVLSPLSTIIGAGIVMAVCFSALLCIPCKIVTLSCMFILVGVASAYQILAISQASLYVPEAMAGFSCAVANMIIMLFGYLFHTTIGMLISQFGGVQSPQAILVGMSVIPLMLWIGTLGFCVLLKKEKTVTQTI
jgi:predicted MFS family arabinose efflux permease